MCARACETERERQREKRAGGREIVRVQKTHALQVVRSIDTWQAINNGVAPTSLVALFTSIVPRPLFSSKDTTVAWPKWHATERGVCPLGSAWFHQRSPTSGAAVFSSDCNRTTRPLSQAWMIGEWQSAAAPVCRVTPDAMPRRYFSQDVPSGPVTYTCSHAVCTSSN